MSDKVGTRSMKEQMDSLVRSESAARAMADLNEKIGRSRPRWQTMGRPHQSLAKKAICRSSGRVNDVCFVIGQVEDVWDVVPWAGSDQG